MIFALKDSKLQRYIDGNIIKLVFLVTIENKVTMTIFVEAKQEAQDKIDFWTKDNMRALEKMG